jgi:hypothetical protein
MSRNSISIACIFGSSFALSAPPEGGEHGVIHIFAGVFACVRVKESHGFPFGCEGSALDNLSALLQNDCVH